MTLSHVATLDPKIVLVTVTVETVQVPPIQARRKRPWPPPRRGAVA
jgi:hypothetical protein